MRGPPTSVSTATQEGRLLLHASMSKWSLTGAGCDTLIADSTSSQEAPNCGNGSVCEVAGWRALNAGRTYRYVKRSQQGGRGLNWGKKLSLATPETGFFWLSQAIDCYSLTPFVKCFGFSWASHSRASFFDIPHSASSRFSGPQAECLRRALPSLAKWCWTAAFLSCSPNRPVTRCWPR